MTSPTRSLRHSPPRRPLHERSESQANQRASRIVDDPSDSIYKNTPYPTHPSHILSPKHASRSGLVPKVFEDSSATPSQEHPSIDLDRSFRTPQDKKKRDLIDPEDVENDYGNSVRPLSIGNPKPIAVPPLNFNPPTLSLSNTGRMEESIDEENSDLDEIVQLPSVFTFPDLSQPVVAAPESHDTSSQQHNDAKSSDLSLSSSESTGTVLRHKIRPSRSSYSAFPPVSRPNSSKSRSSPTTPQRAFPSSSDDGSSVSPASAGSATFSTPEIRQASAATISRQHRVISDPVHLQYPVVRQPSASSSWAESSKTPQNAIIQRPQRTLDRNHERWNPHLSTVPSELIEERGSDSIWFPSPIGASQNSPHASNLSVAEQQRDVTASTIRMVNESDDNISNLLSPIPGSRGSTYYSRLSGGSKIKRKSVPQARPTSKGSFFRDSIPAWAKLYYARSNSALALPEGRQDANPTVSSESLTVRRIRPKPKANAQVQTNRDSLAIGPAPQNETALGQMQGEPRQQISQLWSPHLWQDRANVGRRNFFKAPSLDQHAEGPFSRRNAQVLLFTFGFIFPLAWFIASVLPLPRKPTADFQDPTTEPQPTHDLEKRLGMVDEARYENARWWRNLNRLMCIVGVLIIAAIIALAVVAVKMRN
ncbi:MAG: hypothetical protein Q9216_000758 [Gyalolechia sp. 2 TL-2023]